MSIGTHSLLLKMRLRGIWFKLATNGRHQKKSFSVITLPPFYNFKPQGNMEKIIAASRAKYAGERKEIERTIEKQYL